MKILPIYKCNQCEYILETNQRSPTCPKCQHKYLQWLNYAIFDIYNKQTIEELTQATHTQDVPNWTTKQQQQALKILQSIK